MGSIAGLVLPLVLVLALIGLTIRRYRQLDQLRPRHIVVGAAIAVLVIGTLLTILLTLSVPA